MKKIQSAKNPRIKELKKLHKKKHREEGQEYLLEGFHLIEEAVNSQVIPKEIFLTEKGWSEWGAWIEQHVLDHFLVTDEVMSAISDLPTPQGIVAVMPLKVSQSSIDTGGWLLLDNVQDPGNVGTMIRTADAFGLAGVILGKGTADIYSTKVLRSMQGSNYHLPVIVQELDALIPELKAKGFAIYGTELNEEAISLPEVIPTKNYVIIMGNEGQGVRSELLALTDKNIYIPMNGHAESLNVGVATGILLYHLSS